MQSLRLKPCDGFRTGLREEHTRCHWTLTCFCCLPSWHAHASAVHPALPAGLSWAGVASTKHKADANKVNTKASRKCALSGRACGPATMAGLSDLGKADPGVSLQESRIYTQLINSLWSRFELNGSRSVAANATGWLARSWFHALINAKSRKHSRHMLHLWMRSGQQCWAHRMSSVHCFGHYTALAPQAFWASFFSISP